MDDGFDYDPTAPANRYPLVWLRRVTPQGEVLYLTSNSWGSHYAARRMLRHEAEKLQGELVPILGHIELEDAVWV
jgi:hypothetical protein